MINAKRKKTTEHGLKNKVIKTNSDVEKQDFSIMVDSTVDALTASSTSTQTLSVSGSTSLNNTTNNGTLSVIGSTVTQFLTVYGLSNLSSITCTTISALASTFTSITTSALATLNSLTVTGTTNATILNTSGLATLNQLSVPGTTNLAGLNTSSLATLNSLIVTLTTKINSTLGVGLGTGNAFFPLHVKGTGLFQSTTSSTDSKIIVSSQAEAKQAAVYLGTPFDVAAPNKVAIIADPTGAGGYSRSNLKFCLENSLDNLVEVSVANTKMVITPGGNVGIGLANSVLPIEKLEVSGNVYVSNTGDCKNSINSSLTSGSGILAFGTGTGTQRTAIIAEGQSSLGNAKLHFCLNDAGNASVANTKMTITPTGSVGIGFPSPTEKLEVNGNIKGSTLNVSGGVGVNAARKIVLFDDAVPSNDFQFSGFGHASDALKYCVAGLSQDHVFYRGSSTTSQSELLRISSFGSVGINESSPNSTGLLVLKQRITNLSGNLNNENGSAITIKNTTATNRWQIGINGGNNLNFWFNGVEKGYMDNTFSAGQIDFTGQHRSRTKEPLSHFSDKIGYIVSSTGVYNNFYGKSDPTINESLPIVEISDIEYDKRVFGVVSYIEEIGKRKYEQGSFVSVMPMHESDQRICINSLGEGGIYVCNINGNIENGDYITSSIVPGIGMKQKDDLLHSYTVAKATCSVNFDKQVPKHLSKKVTLGKQEYTIVFIGCTYHCG